MGPQARARAPAWNWCNVRASCRYAHRNVRARLRANARGDGCLAVLASIKAHPWVRARRRRACRIASKATQACVFERE
eukprot:6186611-Pleurochrysis_carterae.AAC.1